MFHKNVLLTLFLNTEDDMTPFKICLPFWKSTGILCHVGVAIVFSSTELKAQVSFSDHLSSIVCLSVHLSDRPSVNFSHFHLFSPEPLS